MLQHFRHRTIHIPLCFEQHQHRSSLCTATCHLHPLTVTELVGSGLAIQSVHDAEGLGPYTLVHISSGMLLSPYCVSTIVQAGRWIRAVAPLCDWTRSAWQVQPPAGVSAGQLARQIEEARWQALEATKQERPCHAAL